MSEHYVPDGVDPSSLPLFALAGAGGAMALLGAIAGRSGGVLLFTLAAQRLPYSTMGMIQFSSPSLVFLIGLFVFGKPLGAAQLASFALIWAAIALFVIDLLARSRRA